MPTIEISTVVGELDQRSTSFLLPMQFPMGPEEFVIDPNILHPIIDPSMPFYSTTGVNTTISPAILPMAGMGSYVVQMDTTHSRDMRTNAQSILYQQSKIGSARDGGFMDGPDSKATSVVLQDPRMTPSKPMSLKSHQWCLLYCHQLPPMMVHGNSRSKREA
jgi:hypothetical protein